MNDHIGVAITQIHFPVEPSKFEDKGYYFHVDPVIDYMIFLPNQQLIGQCTLEYAKYKEMKHCDLMKYIKGRFIEVL